jgi:hypothetical protein
MVANGWVAPILLRSALDKCDREMYPVFGGASRQALRGEARHR